LIALWWNTQKFADRNYSVLLTGAGIEDEAIFVPGLIEIKHLIDGLAIASKLPWPMRCPLTVVLDEAQHRRLVVTVWSTKFSSAQGDIPKAAGTVTAAPKA
jgi:hypothetical protein